MIIVVKGLENVEELYQMIEQKIKASGYPGAIDGKEFYDEVNEEALLHENGTDSFMIKKTDTMFYEGRMVIMDSDFDLQVVDIHDNGKVYHVDFDA